MELRILTHPGGDLAFPDKNVVKALLAMISALRLVAGRGGLRAQISSPRRALVYTSVIGFAYVGTF